MVRVSQHAFEEQLGLTQLLGDSLSCACDCFRERVSVSMSKRSFPNWRITTTKPSKKVIGGRFHGKVPDHQRGLPDPDTATPRRATAVIWSGTDSKIIVRRGRSVCPR